VVVGPVEERADVSADSPAARGIIYAGVVVPRDMLSDPHVNRRTLR